MVLVMGEWPTQRFPIAELSRNPCDMLCQSWLYMGAEHNDSSKITLLPNDFLKTKHKSSMFAVKHQRIILYIFINQIKVCSAYISSIEEEATKK